MSPAAAIENPIFRTYLAIVGTLVIAGGLTIFFLRVATKRDVSHAWKSYRGWLVMIPLVFAAIFLGRIATIAFLTIVAVIGFKEYARATGLYRDWIMTGAVYLAIIAAGVTAAIDDPNQHTPGWYGLYMALPVYTISVLLALPIVRNRSQGQLQSISLAILGYLYIGWMFGHLGFLANSENAYGYILYLLFAVELNDVAAYTFGKFFGRHPLRSNISPKKTWEGAVGALLVSLALPWLLRFSLPHFGALQLVLAGLIVGIGGQLGDLVISVIKRDLGVKDMGAVLSGHGGILDRIDSLIFVSPLFFHMTRFFYGL